MTTSRCGVLAMSVLVAAGGCGSDSDDTTMGPCWPLKATAGGSVELGTGDLNFEPMPDNLPIIRNGTQSDPFIFVHSRMRGMPPGDPENPFDSANPHTKVGMTVESLGMTFGVECPASIGYVPSPEESGAYDLVHSLRIGVGSFNADMLDMQQATITLEVVGSNDKYAHAEKVVTLSAPPLLYDAGVR